MRDGDDERRGGRGRGRAGGYRGTPRDDRHSKTGVSDHEKQVAHGWGGNTGGEEWADEKAGEAIAKAEEKEGFGTNVPAPVNADGEAFAPDTNFVSDNAAGDGKAEGFGEAGEAELEEPIVKSYEDYLAEQANKKLHLGGDLEARRANEGSSKKFPEGKAFARANENENFFVGGQGKAKRERQKKEKSVLELDGQAMRPQEPRSERGRGGRGRGRGGDRGGDRGEFRDRGEHRERGEFRERGDFRGRGRGDRAPRGEYRGSRGGRGGQSGIQINDQSAFPTLGS
jgi:plasminogen activator inhibitor 1 RNA-binding protein